uniref:AlNc14C1515G12975 protein n=1 Tax=Albugo laibachii Nc14 TaxID=890382 RepID=F0X2R2_9STRA|nr:AlNc14C1515G12975 [Albugo laibachii Nc14]|eukprot:CCA28202.1 AlNc14C1515G12975 [Albugo laibachii Nc14]
MHRRVRKFAQSLIPSLSQKLVSRVVVDKYGCTEIVGGNQCNEWFQIAFIWFL